MINSLTITYQSLDLRDPGARSTLQEVLNSDVESSFYQSDGSHLPSDTLLQALNAFTNEDEAEDLTLDQLEDLSGGVGLPEALVSSTILMAMVSGACGFFVNSMGAGNNSQFQDALNAEIHANIEEVRNDLANHDFNAATGTYNPTAGTGQIGDAFLQDRMLNDAGDYNDVDGDPTNNVIETNLSIGGETVTRIITAEGNSITVEYTYSERSGTTSGSTSRIQSTSMVAPAAGWLS